MTSSLSCEYDTKVLDYLEALDKKYKCLICNGFLTCARIIECGHAFCAYCLDILESTKSTCPVCDHSIRPAVPAPQIDREVEEMLQYCSGDLYAAYQKAKASRIEKQKERSKTLKELADNIHAKEDKTNPSKPYKRARNMEEVCSKLAESVANRPITDIIPDCMINQNKANEQPKQQQKKTPSKPKSKTGLQSGRSIPNEQVGNGSSFGNSNTALPTSSGLDIPRVEALFKMYDNLLLSPPDSRGSGDAEESLNYQENIPTASQAVETEEMKAARHKTQQEIELLVRDTDEAVDLYEFVHKWTDQIRDVALGGKQRQIEEEVKSKSNAEKGLVPMEWMDSQLALPDVEGGLPQTLDDVAAEELWKTSLNLIKRFRELENKGKQTLGSQQISNPSRLSIDPDWDSVELDMSIDNVSKAIKTQFDEEYMRLLEGDRLRESRNLKEEPSTGRSDEPHMNFAEDITEDGIEFFNKILRCKSALNDLKEKSKPATDPQHIRNLLPVQEFKEPSKSKSQTSVLVEPKHWKSELWIPEIEESNFQHYTKMLQSRSVAYPPPETYGSQSGSAGVCISKHSNLKSLSTPRTARSRPLSLPSPRPQRSNSGRLSGRLSPVTSRRSSFK